ncbi:hypothetical protein [Flavobacterium wongokense]|uniref:hypothetical protein n=1 Tax=Flavobacterium wongokense TaxID=2910674 RepID=UPI001F241799|nr:hypothetical protein [Flavobacterium sp. WG47]MCF6132739.1 hypothetical protein [Flavobacterium sp. WG47]
MDLEICTSNVKSIIASTNTSGEKIKVIDNFIEHYAYLTYSYNSICIYKLFHINEKRSFLKLLNKLEHNQYDIELLNLLHKNNLEEESENLFTSKSQIIDTVKRLRILIGEKEELIIKIKNRRNTFYAHSDPEKKFPPETLGDLIEIKQLAVKLFQILYGGLFGSHYMFENYYWSVNPVLDTSIFMHDYYKNLERTIEKS